MSTTQGTPPCTHRVGQGDTFYELARAYYGDASNIQAQKIQDANPGVSPTSLQLGQILNIFA
ncbi:LysM domain-containing protein [Nostoc sp. ChiVER01]|uniref:LysM peptidoglycan-binding domain-containing protein n=1 Tax=Nostoc sp. ChiVER01 TaxID=3075382 RepID=UPI002AD43386|nr:LysM domain-containing protein [Nostoc sp. ChiVER01]MDZ8225120.1 LysM domain-containing protein [Nostoc sp. ChiVER01]